MNPRETAVLAAVQRHYARYGVPPTIRYIMRRTNIPSSDTVFYYYKKLVQAKEIVLAGSPGSQRKPVPISIFNLITQKETLPNVTTRLEPTE
jgi:SOS-response transcriptional repressor LexA